MIRIASLWVEDDGTLGGKGFVVRKVEGEKWDAEIGGGGGDKPCGRLFKAKNPDGKLAYSGSMGDLRVMVFKNDRSGNDRAPAFDMMVEEEDERGKAKRGGGNTVQPSNDNGTTDPIPW